MARLFLIISLDSSCASSVLADSQDQYQSLRVPLHFPLNMLDHKSPLCFSQQEGCLG